jgi:hypothetical protein
MCGDLNSYRCNAGVEDGERQPTKSSKLARKTTAVAAEKEWSFAEFQ